MNKVEYSFVENALARISLSDRDVLYYFWDYMLLLTKAEWKEGDKK